MKAAHPSVYMLPHWVKTIRNASPQAEISGMMHPDQLSIIYEQKWFKLLVPKVYSGLEKSIPDLLRIEESISWINGSVGWVVTLCSGAGWFGGFLQQQKAIEVFNTPNVCLAGSGAANGEAVIIPGGYKINGFWKYASGAHHATHFTANCIIKNDEGPVLNEDGSKLILSFIFDSKDVQLVSAWKYTGMAATGGDAFEVKDLIVNTGCCFKVDASDALIKSALYQYPFLQLAEATLAVNISGMAVHFIDLCKDIFTERLKRDSIAESNKAFLKEVLAEQEILLNTTRTQLFEAADTSWADIENQQLLTAVSLTSRKLAKIARECVDTLYPYCGLIAASADSEINQVWRDIHTASQHALLTFINPG